MNTTKTGTDGEYVKKLILAALLTIPLPAHAADEKQPAPLTEEEKQLGAAGLKELEEIEKAPNKKPLPAHLRDKMQSGVGEVEPAARTKAKKQKVKAPNSD